MLGGQKVYVSSLALFTIGTIIVAISRHIALYVIDCLVSWQKHRLTSS